MSPASEYADATLRRIARQPVNTALVSVFEEIDDLLRRGLWCRCDDMLRLAFETFDAEDVDAADAMQLVIGMLTATLPAKSDMPSRTELLRQAGSRLGESGDEVLAGL